MILHDEELIQNLKKFGYRIAVSEQELRIDRRLKIPEFLWLLIAGLVIILLNYPFNPSILIAGIAVILISLIAFYRNVTSRIIFNKKDKTILFKKGLFRTDHYRYFKDVQELRYRTYDVKNSASQFTKGAREYIADIRLLWRDQGSIEMCYFSRRVKEEIQLAETVFVELSVYTGFENTTTIVP